ncbi:MAG: HAMP domain-containing histidine kinase [Clostridia bacterium]|nr:HAMP domain-containing histidine kinase [Clostridia bacterium]
MRRQRDTVTSAEIPSARKHTRAKPRRERATRRGHFGVQGMLLISLAVFTGFVMLVLGIFQVGLLDTFYRSIRDRSMNIAAGQIEQALSARVPLEDAIYDLAEDHALCVLLYRVEGDVAVPVASADVSNDCIIHHITGDYISNLYAHAMQNGGDYHTTVSMHMRNQYTTDEEEEDHPDLRRSPVSALMIRVVEGADKYSYVILLDAELTPINATISTLTVQFLWIAALLFCGVLVLAYVLSRVITRPLVRMNEAAKLLARGRYDAHFSGDGYRETRELAQTLNYAASELSRVDELQKELIANISHDLRTPLTMITGYSEVMRDIPGENTPENVQVIIDEAEHLSALVNDLLDLSRVQSGARRALPEQFNLTDTVRRTITRYDKLTRHEGYVIAFSAEEDIDVFADSGMILQVVYNLINNAINYCGEDHTVEVSQLRRGDCVRVCVTDHGEGIPPEQLTEIWNRYYKIDRVHRRAMVGTGLGLSIVKEILDQHGSDYGVESTPGQGSTFWFELPILETPPTPDDEHHVMGETVDL